MASARNALTLFVSTDTCVAGHRLGWPDDADEGARGDNVDDEDNDGTLSCPSNDDEDVGGYGPERSSHGDSGSDDDNDDEEEEEEKTERMLLCDTCMRQMFALGYVPDHAMMFMRCAEQHGAPPTTRTAMASADTPRARVQRCNMCGYETPPRTAHPACLNGSAHENGMWSTQIMMPIPPVDSAADVTAPEPDGSAHSHAVSPQSDHDVPPRRRWDNAGKSESMSEAHPMMADGQHDDPSVTRAWWCSLW